MPQLDKEVEMGFYQPTPVQGIFAEISRIYFGGRLQVRGETDATFEGEISLRPLRQVLAAICNENRCKWSVGGDPPTLIFDGKGENR